MRRTKAASPAVIRLDRFLPYQVAQLSDRLLIKNSALEAGGQRMTTQEWRVIAIVASFGPLTPADIRRHSTQDKSTISWAIKRLTASGLMRKTAAEDDARTFRVALSAAGWRYYGLIVPQAHALERDVFKRLTRRETAELRRLMDKLTR